MVESSSRSHVLLANMGANKPRETTYRYGEIECPSCFSAVALWKMLPPDQKPSEIRYLLTPEAAAVAKEQIISEAREAGVPVAFVELPGNEMSDDSRVVLETVADSLPEGSHLTLDVTQGLRHHAFLFYALALYLSEFRSVHISGAWYCRWEISRDENVPRPFIDLKPVLDLARWFHALAVFRETGSLREITRRMPEGELQKLTEQLSFFFVNGMPIEGGNAASLLVKAAENQQLVADVPLAEKLQEVLLHEIQRLAGATFEAQPKTVEQSKKRIPLTEKELQRQARLIDQYFETGQLNLAFGLLREWIVNRIAAESQRETWLERQSRESIEHQLGGLGAVIKAKDPTDPRKKRYRHQAIRETLSDDQRDWATRWNRIADIRNALQHHGMKPATFEPHRGDISKAREDWQQHESWPDLEAPGGGQGRLLLCPIGHTPGVLFSALRHTRPNRVVVVCSEQSAGAIETAVEKAESQVDILRLQMEDVHCGVTEFEKLITEASLWLFEADEVVACLTGGTTLMGVLVTRLVARASREYQRPVRQFVLIDPRTPEEQRTYPWKKGNIHYLDEETEQTS